MKLESIGVLVQAIEERDLLERMTPDRGFYQDRTGVTPADTEAARLDALDAVADLLRPVADGVSVELQADDDDLWVVLRVPSKKTVLVNLQMNTHGTIVDATLEEAYTALRERR